MYLENSKAIYISIPRVASTSIQESLLRNIDEDSIGHQDLVNYEQAEDKYGKPALNKNFVFSFVRNPWDRMVSIFFHQAETNPKLLYSTGARTFEDFVNEVTQNRLGTLHDLCHTQVSMLKNKFSDIRLDYTGRFEELNRDYKTVCEAISIEPTRLRKLNQSYHFNYKHYYNDDLKSKVARFFEEDIDTFKYTF